MNVIDLILPSDFLVGFFALQMVLECLKCLGPINFYDNQKVFTTSTSFLWAVRLHTGDLQLKAGISISTLELE